MRNALSNNKRKQIIEDVNAGVKKKEAAKKYKVHYNTVLRLVRLWKKTGEIMPLALNNGRRTRLTKEQLTAVENKIVSQPDITLLTIIDVLNLPMSESNLSRIVREKLKFRLKKNSSRQRTKQD